MSAHKLNDVYCPKQHFKVIVKTITYNQAKYIQDTLNSIAMQITDFPFVNVVLEDNSTDGEQDVIRLWLERECDMSSAEYYDIPTAVLIIAPHKENINCTFAIYFHKKNLYQQKDIRESQVHPWRFNSQYEAWCEGDDYWIDPLKLQKQVDFMEANPNYGFVITDINRFYQSTGKIEQNFFSKQLPSVSITFYELLINAYWLAPCTWLYRTNLYEDIKMPDDCFKGDIAIALGILKQSKMFKMNESTACYRVLEQSASHFNDTEQADSFYLSVINTRCYFASSLNYSQKLRLLFKITKELRGRFVNRRRKRIDLFLQNTISVVKKIYEIH